MIFDELTNSLADKFLQHGYIFIIGDINKKIMTSVILQLKYLVNTDLSDIYIFIHSGGGDVECAMSIIDEINLINDGGKNVYTIASGSVASAAIYILACGKKRYGSENATYMLHPISYSLDDYHEKNKEYVNFAEKFNNKILLDLALRCKKEKKAEIQKFIQAIERSMWTDTEGAIELGLIDEKWSNELEKGINDIKSGV